MHATNSLDSRPAFQILGERKGWKPVLRKFGMILFGVSPDEDDANLDETHKVCANLGHFLNAYLCVNKSSGTRSAGMPSLVTARAFQRSATIMMSGFLFSAFATAKPNKKIIQLRKYIGAQTIYGKMKEVNNDNPLSGLGYDICLRNWILVSKNDLAPYIEKGRTKAKQGYVTLEAHERLEQRILNLEQSVKYLEERSGVSADEETDDDDDESKKNSGSDEENKEDDVHANEDYEEGKQSEEKEDDDEDETVGKIGDDASINNEEEEEEKENNNTADVASDDEEEDSSDTSSSTSDDDEKDKSFQPGGE